MPEFRLLKPELDLLAGYVAALERGWSPDNIRLAAAALEERAAIASDPVDFVRGLDDREARGGPVTLADGSKVPRLPGFRRWMWDDDFCGSIGFRWRPGASDLPPHCLGHIGYAVPSWRSGRGYATRALALLLDEIRDLRDPGLAHVDLTTDPDNAASQAVILANGGKFVRRFETTAAYGHKQEFLFRIEL